MKQCPFCAEMIQDEAVFCRYCRRDLPPPPSHLPQELPESESIHKWEKIQRLLFVILVILLIILGTLFFRDMMSVETAGRLTFNPLLLVGGLMAWLGRKPWVRNLGWFLLLGSTCSLLLNDPFLT